MTDRVNGFTVILDKDYRDDDVEVIANAIRMIKGVKAVENHIVTTADHIAEAKTVLNIRAQLLDFIQNLK